MFAPDCQYFLGPEATEQVVHQQGADYRYVHLATHGLIDPDHPMYHEKEFVFDIFKIRRVKSSNGQVEDRISIKTEISLFEKIFPIELTLTERTAMKHPVLLGRKFISKKFPCSFYSKLGYPTFRRSGSTVKRKKPRRPRTTRKKT